MVIPNESENNVIRKLTIAKIDASAAEIKAVMGRFDSGVHP